MKKKVLQSIKIKSKSWDSSEQKKIDTIVRNEKIVILGN